MRSLIVALIGFNELWHHLPSCNILDYIHVILNIAYVIQLHYIILMLPRIVMVELINKH
jgi:hypothetical protein